MQGEPTGNLRTPERRSRRDETLAPLLIGFAIPVCVLAYVAVLIAIGGR